MKKTIFVCVVLLASIMLFSGCKKKSSSSGPSPTPRPRRVDKNVNQEPFENRPYVRLLPQADGKSVTLEIVALKKQAADVEYEIEYSSGSLLQGAFGVIDPLKNLPVSKNILLGSCSSGGKCTYNKDVTGGTLTLRFGNPDYTLRQEWSYSEKATTQKIFSSRDGKFTLDIAKAKNNAPTLLIYNTPGIPGKVERSVIVGPYTVAPSGTISGSVTVSVRVPAETKTATLMAYDGQSWKEVSSTVKDGQVSATGTLAQVYVVVTK